MTVSVSAADRTVVTILDSLAIQFEHFTRTPSRVAEVLDPLNLTEGSPQEPLISLRLQFAPTQAGSPKRKHVFLFRNRLCRVSTWGRIRTCDYGNGTLCRAESFRSKVGLRRKFEIKSASLEHLHEVVYLAILSAVGEELEVRGMVRLHALGLLYDNKAFVLMMPSGCGKSSLAVLAIKKELKHFLFSDEIVLYHLKQRVVLPFPLPISLKPSVAENLDLPPTAGRSFKRKIFGRKLHHSVPRGAIAPPAPLGPVALCSPSKVSNLQMDMSMGLKARLVINVLLGLGLPQMTEHLLRLDALARLLTILINRWRLAWRICRFHSLYNFQVSTRPLENFATLISEENPSANV